MAELLSELPSEAEGKQRVRHRAGRMCGVVLKHDWATQMVRVWWGTHDSRRVVTQEKAEDLEAWDA